MAKRIPSLSYDDRVDEGVGATIEQAVASAIAVAQNRFLAHGGNPLQFGQYDLFIHVELHDGLISYRAILR